MTLSGLLTSAWIVVGKELKDASRDRRAIMSILISSLFAPVLVGFMLNRVADRQRDVEDVRIPVVGMEHAPALIAWLRQQDGVEVVSGPKDAEGAVRDRREEVVVVIPAEFADKFRSAKPAEVRIVADGSNSVSEPKVRRVRELFQRYSSQIGAMRLIARGVSPAVVTPLRVDDVEVSSAQQRAARALSFIPMFILLAAFTAGMQIATDSTAGERERGSLEPLLVTPAPREAIAGGKWASASFAAMLSVMLTATLCVTMLQFVPLQELGVRFRLGSPQVGGLLAAMLPMCPLAAGVQMYLATFARSFKEAQSYMGLLIMIPMLPGVLGALYPMNDQPWFYPVPIVGQYVLMTDVLGGKMPSAGAFLLAGSIALAAAVLFVRLTTGLFRRERIIFGR
jgi:sodium transport system permease protein